MLGSAGWWRSSATASRTGIINKTKQKHKRKTARRSQAKTESQGRRAVIEKKKKKIRFVAGIAAILISFFFFKFCPLAWSWRHPGGGGVFKEGPETRSWRNTQRKRRLFFLFFLLLLLLPARSLREDAAVLRSEHPFSDWLLEGAQGSG